MLVISAFSFASRMGQSVHLVKVRSMRTSLRSSLEFCSNTAPHSLLMARSSLYAEIAMTKRVDSESLLSAFRRILTESFVCASSSHTMALMALVADAPIPLHEAMSFPKGLQRSATVL